jgi:hypothetical protein
MTASIGNAVLLTTAFLNRSRQTFIDTRYKQQNQNDCRYSYKEEAKRCHSRIDQLGAVDSVQTQDICFDV